MGQSQSTQLEPEDISSLKESSPFDAAEIIKLYNRFQNLDRNRLGLVSLDTLMGVPELAVNPLANRLRRVFEAQTLGRGEVNFKQFLGVLAVFSKNTKRISDLH
jgi:serine/threonine-protein phosphatase 2B regulatory subunit